VPKGTQKMQSWINKIRQKHVDYVICTKDTCSPVLVIELDDSSHQREDRKERDAEVGRILQTAGLPILHCPAKKGYVISEVVQALSDKLLSKAA